MLKYFWILLLIFVGTYTVNSQDSIPKEIPLDILFKKNNRSHFAISPDGKYYIEVIDKNRESYLFKHKITLNIIDIDKYELIHRIPLDLFGIDAVYWLTNNRIIYESKGSIKAVDIDGSNLVEIVSRIDTNRKSLYRHWRANLRYNSIINLLYDKEHQILVQTYDSDFHAAIKEINIFTGEEYVVMNADKHKVNHWITDAYGNIKMAVKISEKGMSYYYKYDSLTNSLKPFIVKIEGNQYSFTIDPRTHIKQYLTFEGFGYSPNIMYITSNIFSDKRKLFSYDIEKEEVVETFVADVNCDVKEIDGKGIKFIFDYKNAEIAGFKYTCLTPKYKWISSSFSEKVKKLNDQFPEYFNEIIDQDYLGNRLLIHQWSDSSTGNIGVYDVKENSYAVMFQINEELNQYPLSKSKVIIAKTRDNYNIPCYFNLPVNYKENEKLPLVVLPHGGPWARDYWGLDDFSHYFTSRGYATLRINYRGSTGFGKSHVLAGVSSLDEVMINDIADATEFVLQRFPLDNENVFMFGHSYGGYATYFCLVKYSHLYKAGISIAAPTDIKAWMKKQKDDDNYYSFEFWNTALGSNEPSYLKKISPINYADQIYNPILIMHGGRDNTVPIEQAEIMIDKIKKHNKNLKFRLWYSADHSFTDVEEFKEMLEESNQFLKKHLKSN